MKTQKRKTRVAFCLRDLKVGGVESVLTRTLESLSRFKDLDIVVVTYTPIREVWRDWFAAHKNISVRVLYPCRLFGTDLPHFFLTRILKHFARDVYRVLRRVLFNHYMFRDIDVAVDYYDFDCVRELSKLNIPRIAWWHSSDEKFEKGNFVKYVAQYDKFVVLTDAFAGALISAHPEIADKVVRVYNPTDVADIRDQATVSPKCAGEYFVVVSRLVNGKDIKTVIKAFDIFCTKNKKPDVRLVIVGDGYKMDEFKSLARKSKYGNSIDFMGAMKNPMGVMGGALANILSSEKEGFALVLVEAASLGVLNIASDCHYGPREILMDGHAGLLFPIGDADALAQHMKVAYNKTTDVKKLITIATRNLKRFDIEKITETIHNLLLNTNK